MPELVILRLSEDFGHSISHLPHIYPYIVSSCLGLNDGMSLSKVLSTSTNRLGYTYSDSTGWVEHALSRAGEMVSFLSSFHLLLSPVNL